MTDVIKNVSTGLPIADRARYNVTAEERQDVNQPSLGRGDLPQATAGHLSDAASDLGEMIRDGGERLRGSASDAAQNVVDSLPDRKTLAERMGAGSAESYYFGGEAARTQALAESLSGRSHETEDTNESLTERARDASDAAKAAAEDAGQNIRTAVDELQNKAEDLKTEDTNTSIVGKIKEKAVDAKDYVKDTYNGALDTVAEKAQNAKDYVTGASK